MNTTSPLPSSNSILTRAQTRLLLALALAAASAILLLVPTGAHAASASKSTKAPNDFVITAPYNTQTVSKKFRLNALITRKLKRNAWSLEFWVDGVRVGTDTKAPFSKVIDSRSFGNGQHMLRVSLVVKKKDGSGPNRQVCQYLRSIYVNFKNSNNSINSKSAGAAAAKTSAGKIPKPEAITTKAFKKKGWSLRFNDEFNGTSLDRTKWNDQRDDWIKGGTPYNNREGAWYNPENVTVSNGSLVQTLNQQVGGDLIYSNKLFNNTTGMVNSSNHYAFKYGYAEARVNVPSCASCWPVFWTLPTGNTWPPEIDIFEYIDTSSIQRRPFMASHWMTPAGQQSKLNYYTEPCGTATDYTQKFHTYGMLWTPTFIQPFLDGVPGPKMTGDAVPHVEMYMIMILSTSILQTDKAPGGSKMLTDFVRVWQPKSF